MTSVYRNQVMLVLSDEQVDTLLKTLQPQTHRAIAMWPQEKSENVAGNTTLPSSGTVGSGVLPTRFLQPERRRFQPEPRRNPTRYRTGPLAVQQGQRIPARYTNVESETLKARVWVVLQRSEPTAGQEKYRACSWGFGYIGHSSIISPLVCSRAATWLFWVLCKSNCNRGSSSSNHRKCSQHTRGRCRCK